MSSALPRPFASLPSIADEPALSSGGLDVQNIDFKEFFDEHVALVWRLLRAMGVPEAHVPDATQEVFLVAHAKLGEFEGRSKMSTWMYAITYRVGANARRRYRREARHLDVEDLPLVSPDAPERTLMGKQTAEIVLGFLSKLEVGMRDVFVLRFLEERSLAETAEVLGIGINTVSSRVRLLRAGLERALSEQPREEGP